MVLRNLPSARVLRRLALLVVTTFAPLSDSAVAVTWVVHADGSGDHPHIPAAMAAATAGDTVLVTPGVYTTLVEARAGEWAAVVMKSGVALLSSDGPEVTILDAADEEHLARGVTCIECESSTVVEGFTIVGGDLFDGAGMLVEGGSPSIRGNRLLDNTGGQGGAITVRNGARPRIVGNLFARNNACCGLGGAVHVEGSSPTILDNDFESCVSAWDGGAVSLVDAGGELSGNRFSGNVATHGGAVYVSDSTTEIAGNVFAANRASSHGGAVAFTEGSSLLFAGNVVESNVADGFGGGLYIDESSPVILRTTVRDNEAVSQGGGIYVDGRSEPGIRNSIVAMNRGWDGLVVAHPLSDVEFQCNDFFGNEGEEFWGFVDTPVGSDGNVSVDPMFCTGSSALRSCSRFARPTPCGQVGASADRCPCGFGAVRE